MAGAPGGSPGGSPGSSTPTTSSHQGEHNDREEEEERFARILATAMTAAQQGQPRQAQHPTTARIKMENPEKFDGKPKTPFRTWWESVQEFTAFYPETAGRQWITWVGTLLTDEAKEWHQHRRRTIGEVDTWVDYQAAIQEEYHDPREAAAAFVKLGQLRYKGDIKAYLTALRALNIHAGATGQGLQQIVDLAVTEDILDMRAAQFRGVLNDDEGFLAATYEAGRQVERNRSLKALRNELRGSQPKGSGSGTGRESKGSQNRPQVERNDRRSQTGRSRPSEPAEGQRWATSPLALRGVPQAEIKAHKDAKAQCWRCGNDSHHTLFCYAKRTKGGVDLPEAPAAVAGTHSSKRRREENNGPTTDAPEPKKSRTSAANVEDEDMKEVIPVWADDSSEEEAFAECVDF